MIHKKVKIHESYIEFELLNYKIFWVYADIYVYITVFHL